MVIVVYTDGLENASRRATREQVMDRIKAKQDAYESLSSSMAMYRRGTRAERRSSKDDFFRGDKSAEDPDAW